MRLALEKLKKFFKLEAERGYDNRAVVGGLDKILNAWEAEARASNMPEGMISQVKSGLTQYASLEPEGRQELLRDIWKSLQISREDNPLADAPHRKEVKPTENPPVKDTNRIQGATARPRKRAENGGSTSSQEYVSHPTPSAPPRPPLEETVGLNAPLTVIQGIGAKHAQTLGQLGLNQLGDLLYYFPRRYDDYSQLLPISRLKYGEFVTVLASVQNVFTRPTRGGQLQITEAVVGDGSAVMRLTWFNQPWIAHQLRPGTPISVSGKVEQYLGRPVINNPEWEPLDQEQLHTNRIVPIYSLTARVSQRWLRKIMFQTISYWAQRVADFLPESVRRSGNLIDLASALENAHFPTSRDRLIEARERLAFDEIFLLQLGVLRQKRNWQSAPARIFETPDTWLEKQISELPFPLTAAQKRVIADIQKDLCAGRPMNRLIQGDVGSGKTVVAALAIAMVTLAGAQAAIMAPTSILAEQHYRSMLKLLANEDAPECGILQPDEICLLVGDTSSAEKTAIREALANGTIKVVIGTHALIEGPVIFKDLQLAVVDEQHRFGVAQRAALRSKGDNPHLLVMTATPIPRSLALSLYGDLDLSVIDEMPAGRQIIDTHVLHPSERERAYSLIRAQVEHNRQAFIIYPLVEQGDNEEAKAAVEEQARLQKEVFPKLRLGLLHGRLKPEEKDTVMRQFRAGEYQVLVSTSVVEVGVDIPNATVMLIEGANRFGLAQLHQFRGRVGRGADKSYCLLIPEAEAEVENERLAVMAETNDGFVLADRDLEQRGPGDFLGTRQAGFAELQMASLTDARLIEKARRQAENLFEQDPELERPEHQVLAQMVRRFWRVGQGDIS